MKQTGAYLGYQIVPWESRCLSNMAVLRPSACKSAAPCDTCLVIFLANWSFLSSACQHREELTAVLFTNTLYKVKYMSYPHFSLLHNEVNSLRFPSYIMFSKCVSLLFSFKTIPLYLSHMTVPEAVHTLSWGSTTEPFLMWFCYDSYVSIFYTEQAFFAVVLLDHLGFSLLPALLPTSYFICDTWHSPLLL